MQHCLCLTCSILENEEEEDEEYFDQEEFDSSSLWEKVQMLTEVIETQKFEIKEEQEQQGRLQHLLDEKKGTCYEEG